MSGFTPNNNTPYKKEQWKPPASKITSITNSKLQTGITPPIILCFDTETTDKPPPQPFEKRFEKQIFNDSEIPAENWPRILQLGFILYDTSKMEIAETYDKIVYLNEEDRELITPDALKLHGISKERTEKEGIPIKEVMMMFIDAFNKAEFVVGHNVQFDINVVLAELTLLSKSEETNAEEKEKIQTAIHQLLSPEKNYCTMEHSKPICKLPKLLYDKSGKPVIDIDTNIQKVDTTLDYKGNRKIRNPRLEIAHEVIFKQKQNGKAHDAFVDVAICLRIFMKIYLDIDIIDEENREKNQLIYDILNPTDLAPNEIPQTLSLGGKLKSIKRRRNMKKHSMKMKNNNKKSKNKSRRMKK
jgi:DNA polymerase III epsilon subunit-like protein